MSQTLSPKPAAQNDPRQRLRVAMRLQEIEGNPLNREQVEMFEMFEREGWNNEQCLAHILERAKLLSAE